MQIAKIFTTDGREFVTNDFSKESLSKLDGIERVELIEMPPEEFFQIPATPASERFFAPLKGNREQ